MAVNLMRKHKVINKTTNRVMIDDAVQVDMLAVQWKYIVQIRICHSFEGINRLRYDVSALHFNIAILNELQTEFPNTTTDTSLFNPSCSHGIDTQVPDSYYLKGGKEAGRPCTNIAPMRRSSA